MSLFGVSPEKEKKLAAQMEKLGIKENDLAEKFIRSGGKGGQNVNKTATCVYLEHIPTGLSVKMQRERSQNLNRFFARRLLFEKIENKLFKEKSESRKKIEKIKRQKRKRSKRAKEKMLHDKKLRSAKKETRKPVSFEG